MWGSGRQVEKATIQGGYPALTNAREGCSHGFPEQTGPEISLEVSLRTHNLHLNSKLYSWNYQDMSHLEIDDHEGNVVSR